MATVMVSVVQPLPPEKLYVLSGSAATSFTLAASAPQRGQEGSGSLYTVPTGIAFIRIVYLPAIKK